MEWFAARGFDTWCMDNEGYGRSDKSRPITATFRTAPMIFEAGSEYISEDHRGRGAACLRHLSGPG